MTHIQEFLHAKKTQLRPSSYESYKLWLTRYEQAGDLDTFKKIVLLRWPKCGRLAMSILQAYFKYLGERQLPRPTSTELRLPRIPIDHHEPITEAEHIALISQYVPNTFQGLRNRLLFSLLNDTGIRVGELCALQIHEIDFVLHCASITSEKSYEKRTVFWSPGTQALIEKYLPMRIELSDDTHLLINLTNKKRLTPRGIQLVMADGLKAAGITRTLSPHSYRNKWTVDRRDWPLAALQKALGHRNPYTTINIYSRLNEREYGTLATNHFYESQKGREKQTNIKNEQDQIFAADRRQRGD